jgi:capsular polysaccharide biosynthesis protein
METGWAPEVLEVAPPGEVVRPDFVWASAIDGNVAKFKAQMGMPENRQYTASGLGVYALENVTVVGWDQFVLHEGKVICDTLAGIMFWLPGSLTESFVAHESIHLQQPVPVRRLDDSFVYFVGCEPAWRNYAQWVTQVLPKLVVFVHLSANRPEMRLIMPGYASDSFVGQAIRLLGIPEDKIVRVASEEAVAARHALMMTRIDSWNLPPFCRVAADFLAARIEATREPAHALPRRIYLKRADQVVRKVVNIADLKPTLDRFGFEILEFEGLSLVDQIRVMRTATHMIAEHGAGLANVIFCQAAPVVIELFNPACVQPKFWTMAALAKCSFGFLVGRHVATPEAPAADWNTDYVIEKSEFEAAVAAIVSASA